MRAYPLALLLLFPLAGLAGTPTLPSFDDKLPDPAVSMSEAVRRGESLRLLAPSITERLARNALGRSDALRAKPVDHLPVLKPREDVDFKLRVHSPDTDVDYKMKVIQGDRVTR